MINHQYLTDKGIKDHGTKLDEHGKLIIPARNIYGEITTIQTIAANGEKRFLNGGTKKGSSFTLDDQIINHNGIANITEGFSTAATVQEATGKPTICAFDAGNLLPVAEAIRGRYSDVEIVICGDDDRSKDKNVGREKATAAAIAVGGKVCFPLFKSDNGKPTDFNDLHQREGLEVVRRQVAAAVPTGWPDITLFIHDETPPTTYPISELPPAIRTAAEETARFCKVDPSGPAAVGVSVFATAIGKKATVEERPGLYHHPALFVMIEAGPGMRKSETAKIMWSPLDSWAQGHAEEHKAESTRIGVKNSLVDTAIATKNAEAKKGAADLDDITKKIMILEEQRETVPPSPKLFASDVTEQSLFQLMHDHNGSFAVFSGEGRQVINQILGRNTDGTGEALYLAGISGDTITRDRVGNEKGPEHKAIFNPCLNVCIFVQPDKARELVTTPAMQASGLVQRIDRITPPSTAGLREEAKNEPGLNFIAFEAYRQSTTQILNISAQEKPHKAKLSPEAQEGRRLFHNEIERQLGADGDLSDVADLASKCCSKVVKYALVFHLAETPKLLSEATSQISFDTWKKAEQVGRFHLQESVRLQRSAFADKDLETARKIARWLFSKQIKTFTKSDLMQSGPRPRPDKNEAKDVLENLIEYGVIVKQAKAYKVNPALFNGSLATLAKIAIATLENENSEIPLAMAKTAKVAKLEDKAQDNYPYLMQQTPPISVNGANWSFD